MAALQTDYLSIPARELSHFLKEIKSDDEQVNAAMSHLKGWDYILDKNSIAAGIYVAFENELKDRIDAMMIPQEAKGKTNIQMKKVVDLLTFPDGSFGESPIAGRDQLIKESFEAAVMDLSKRYGDDLEGWNYGSAHYKHITLKHPMSNAVNDEVRAKLEVGPIPRGGNGYTVNMTSNNLNQTSGGSFKIICDTGDWDKTLATNNPGQSGNPDHPHYRNLFHLWARDQYFPLFYSRKKVESVKQEVWTLSPD